MRNKLADIPSVGAPRAYVTPTGSNPRDGRAPAVRGSRTARSRLAALGASAGRPRPPYTLSCAFQTPFTHAFTLLDSGAITHGPIVSKPWCAVSRLQRTVPVATARTRHTTESRHAPPRPRRAQLSLPARPNGGSHMHTSSSVLLAMADLPQASTSRPHASTGASGFAWQVPPLKARRRRRRRPVSACSDA
jgi:hypothetical protein